MSAYVAGFMVRDDNHVTAPFMSRYGDPCCFGCVVIGGKYG
jgi:hypothetical protein